MELYVRGMSDRGNNDASRAARAREVDRIHQVLFFIIRYFITILWLFFEHPAQLDFDCYFDALTILNTEHFRLSDRFSFNLYTYINPGFCSDTIRETLVIVIFMVRE